MREGRSAIAGRPIWVVATLALVFVATQSARHGPGGQIGPADLPPSASPVAAATVGRADRAEPIRLGGIFSLGSPGGLVGRQQWEAARLVTEEINVTGGVLDASGRRRKVELVAYDDEGRPELAAAIVRRLGREENVLAIVGLSDPMTAAAAAAAAEQEQVPLIALAASEPDPTRAAPRWTFSLAHSEIDALTVVLETVSGSQAERVGWIAPRTATAETARAYLVRDTEARGLRVVAEETYSLLEQDVGERLARLATAGAEAIVGWPRGADDAAVIAKAMSRAPRGRLYLGPAAASDTFLTLAGESAFGVRVPVTRLLIADDLWDHDPLTPAIRELIRTFRLAHGHPPGIASAAAWDAMRLVFGAVEQAGPERARVRDALERTSGFAGASGPIDFAPDDHDGLDRRAPLVARVVPGGWRIPP